ncbi:MAG: hypothetical protein AB7W16_01625 [Candidatus Obscuribacterales bacterium]
MRISLLLPGAFLLMAFAQFALPGAALSAPAGGKAKAAVKSGAPQGQQAACKKFVQDFYDWYCKSLGAGGDGMPEDRAMKDRGSSFSPSLRQKIKDDFEASAKVQDEIVGLDFDPYLNSQDPCEHYVAGKVSVSGKNYLVEMHGVRDGKQNAKADVIPEVASQSGRFIFVNFHYGKSEFPENENLVSVLDALKKSREQTK